MLIRVLALAGAVACALLALVHTPSASAGAPAAMWPPTFEPGSILVEVKDASGPLAGVDVSVVDDWGNTVASGTTGGDGSVLFEGIDPGDYKVFASFGGDEQREQATVVSEEKTDVAFEF